MRSATRAHLAIGGGAEEIGSQLVAVCFAHDNEGELHERSKRASSSAGGGGVGTHFVAPERRRNTRHAAPDTASHIRWGRFFDAAGIRGRMEPHDGHADDGHSACRVAARRRSARTESTTAATMADSCDVLISVRLPARFGGDVLRGSGRRVEHVRAQQLTLNASDRGNLTDTSGGRLTPLNPLSYRWLFDAKTVSQTALPASDPDGGLDGGFDRHTPIICPTYVSVQGAAYVIQP